MRITASHIVRRLTENENRDLNIICEKEIITTKCRSYHGNKLKIGDSTLPKVETVTDEEEDNVGTFIPEEEPVVASHKIEMLE